MIPVKRISREYYNYNPNGDTAFILNKCECCGMEYIEEVGFFNESDKQYDNDSFDISINSEKFTVYRKKTDKDLFKTPEQAYRKYKKKEQQNGKNKN